MIYIADVPTGALDHHIAHGPAHYAPVLAGVRDAGLGFAIVPQGVARFRIPRDRPVVVLIGDDLHEALGPLAFHTKSLTRFLVTCRSASIVSSAAHREPYARAATDAAVFRQNTVIIETLPRYEQDWYDLVEKWAPSASILLSTVPPAGNA